MNQKLQFTELEDVVFRMGAESSGWQLPPYLSQKQKDVRKNLETGVELPSLDTVKSGPGGVLVYKGEQVVLYIKQTRHEKYILENYPEDSKRFHIAECVTLAQMRWSNRFERYVTTNRKDGRFLVEDNYGTELESKLRVCKNCLHVLDWKHYVKRSPIQREELWEQFSMQDFFAEYDTFFRYTPQYSDRTLPSPESYGKNWPRIARRVKQKCGWHCRQCGADLSAHTHLLHVHHKNGVLRDIKSENLVALCIVCHAEQPYHQGRIRPSEEEIRIIEKLR